MEPSPRDQSLAADIIREFESLKAIRYNWESYWADIARRILPHQNVFMRDILGVSQAERRTEWIFDSTPPQALENCAALFEAMLFPRTQRWHKLAPIDPKLADNRNIRAYLEDVTDALFAARYSPRANFASQAHENMLGLVAFGTGAIFIDEVLGQNLRYRATPLQDLYFAENHVGLIDRVFRTFEFSAIKAANKWGLDALPEGVKAAAQSPAQMHREFSWLHAVKPRTDFDMTRKDGRNKPFASYYICLTERRLVEEGGYRAFPYATSRYMVGPREVYGRSPAFTALADIKMLNEMSRTDINAAQLAAEPPILLPESGESFRLRPAAMNYGMVTEDGKPLAMPFVTGYKAEIANDKMEQRRQSIKAAFMGNLYEMLMDHPDMTATQTLQLAQERGILLTPAMGRQQSEALGVMIERELDILSVAGQLPPMPVELMRAGGMVKIEFSSPLNRLQRAADGVGMMQTIEQLGPVAEAGHPEVFDLFDWPEFARELADINGVPAHVLLSPEAVAQIAQQKAQAQNAQALIQAAPQAASAAKDLSTAAVTAQNAPQAQPQGATQ